MPVKETATIDRWWHDRVPVFGYDEQIKVCLNPHEWTIVGAEIWPGQAILVLARKVDHAR